jgi:hypothetical protein
MAIYGDTPNATDLFSRVMAGAFEEQTILTTGFMSWFGRTETRSETIYCPDSNYVEIDIQRANKIVAPTIHRGQYAASLGDNELPVAFERFTNVGRKFPLLQQTGPIGANQLLNRLAGEGPYERPSIQSRLRKLANKTNSKMIDMMYRANEYLAAQSMLLGTMPAIIGSSDPNLIYDFYRTAAHQITLGTQWTDVAADAAGDLDDACDQIRVDGNVMPDFVAMGDDAIKWFQLNTAILAGSDNRVLYKNLEIVKQQMPAKYQRFIDSGFKLRFVYTTPKGYELYIFDYKGDYTDSAGDNQVYLPKGYVWVASTQARCDRYFGPGERLPLSTADRQMYQDYFGFDMSSPPQPMGVQEAGGVIARPSFYFDAHRDEQATVLTARVQQAPIYVPTTTDAFCTILNAA